MILNRTRTPGNGSTALRTALATALREAFRLALLPVLVVAFAALGDARADHLAGFGAGAPGMGAMPGASWNASLSEYDRRMDAWVQQTMQQTQQRIDQGVAQAERFFVDYYRQRTGDYATPDTQAAMLGDRLYCQDNPARCRQTQQHADAMGRIAAQGHAQNMQDIDAWGQTAMGVAQSDGAILDGSQQGFLGRQRATAQGQQNYVQGAVRGESTFLDPWGSPVSLPVYPSPGYAYTGPTGLPVQFDYGTETWWQQSYDGSWYQMQQRR